VNLSPALTAAIDQQQATLAEAVSHVREHQAACPIEGNVCPGSDMWDSIQDATRPALDALFALALCQLAAGGVDPLASEGIDRLLAELNEEGIG
jgi:hypothetical protein